MNKCSVCGGIHDKESNGLADCIDWLTREQFQIRSYLDSRGGTLELRPANLVDYIKYEFIKMEKTPNHQKPEPENKTAGGIILPPRKTKARAIYAQILCPGCGEPLKTTENGYALYCGTHPSRCESGGKFFRNPKIEIELKTIEPFPIKMD